MAGEIAGKRPALLWPPARRWTTCCRLPGAKTSGLAGLGMSWPSILTLPLDELPWKLMRFKIFPLGIWDKVQPCGFGNLRVSAELPTEGLAFAVFRSASLLIK